MRRNLLWGVLQNHGRLSAGESLSWRFRVCSGRCTWTAATPSLTSTARTCAGGSASLKCACGLSCTSSAFLAPLRACDGWPGGTIRTECPAYCKLHACHGHLILHSPCRMSWVPRGCALRAHALMAGAGAAGAAVGRRRRAAAHLHLSGPLGHHQLRGAPGR